MQDKSIILFAREILKKEANAILEIVNLIDKNFVKAIEIILNMKGQVILTGLGKAGIIGQKIAATMASTGTPAISLHPVEALHGDLGIVRSEDVVIILSNSGQTREIVELIPHIKKIGAKTIAITGTKQSPLTQYTDVVLFIGDIEEACPLGMAPSTSTTVMLALGDALALTLQKCRKFSIEEYAFFHPAGALGKKLLKVEEVMRPMNNIAWVYPEMSVKDTIIRITSTRSGCACIIDKNKNFLGIFTDGDLRRNIEKYGDILDSPIKKFMVSPAKTIQKGTLVAEALNLLKKYEIDEVPILAGTKLIGLIDIQDIIKIK